MEDVIDIRRWMATAVQVGTNLRMTIQGATKDEVDTGLYGQSYPADPRSVRYYRVEAETHGQ
jgi:hypothetical protein